MRTRATPERIAKLPVWARDYIGHLERDRMEAVKDRDRCRAEQPPSRIVLGGRYQIDDRPVRYFNGKEVFMDCADGFPSTDEEDKPSRRIGMTFRPELQPDGSWYIYVTADGRDLSVLPRAANALYLKVSKR
jgi:hypothetical protein